MARAKRNVLFITADQFRWDSFGAGGNGIVRTPNLDALATDGVTFSNCFVQSAPCGPSRACILTSRYACSHRSIDNMTPLVDATDNLPIQLRRHGYLPAILGANDYAIDPRLLPADDPRCSGLSFQNFLPGWHRTYLHETDSPGYFDMLRGKGYPEEWLNSEEIHKPAVPPEGAGEHLPLRYPARYRAEDSEGQYLTSKTIEFVEALRGTGWFVNVNYIKPHPPRVAPAPYHDMYDPSDMPPANRRAAELDDPHPYYRLMHRERELVDERALRETRANYYSMISELDACLGRLFDAIKAMGEWDNTLVLFGADHGEYLGDHYLLDKGHFYDETMRVPLIVRDPSAEANRTRGGTVDGFVESIDWAPTMLEYLGVPVPDRFQGISVLPVVRGAATGRAEIHNEFDFRWRRRRLGMDAHPDECLLWVVRDERYKYVQFGSAELPPLLFDLQEDPGEFRNLAQDPACASVVAEYCQRLLRWRMRNEDQRMEHWATQYRKPDSFG